MNLVLTFNKSSVELRSDFEGIQKILLTHFAVLLTHFASLLTHFAILLTHFAILAFFGKHFSLQLH